MSSDVVLTSALRSNLLSLQNTQSLIDRTQLRLATGLKVNSALDNPQNFFTSQSLNNRASDLSRLLDGIGQSIRTIETADNGVTALTGLVEQAQSIVTSARDELAASEGEARLVGGVDLSDVADLVTDLGIANGATLDIITTDDSGAQITQQVTIDTGDTAASLAAEITNAFADNENGEITASVTDEGYLVIESSDGRSFRLVDEATTAITQAGLDALGIGDYFATENRTGAGTTDLTATIVAGSTISSISLYEGTGDLVEAGDLISGTYTDASGNAALDLTQGNIDISVTTSDGTTQNFAAALDVTAVTFQDFVDEINNDSNLNTLIEAEFDSSTGQLRITSINDGVTNATINFTGLAAGENIALGFGDPNGNLDPITTGAGAEDISFYFNNSTEALDALAADYNTLREQIDDLVNDAQYRGVNLLNGDDLTTFFNENNTSQLVTSGQIFTANGLGITEATFRSSTEIELSATQARDALESVRNFGSTLANNLSIIQTRQTFTQETINTLTAGADDLVVADQNEEGANLLALQTRQALGVTALSLAAQSQQSVLSLF
ncbi:MAG: flagellin [Alphaproteobacteria bacterium]|nr:flagellin [Alphaproteobacteria bacterium]